MKATGVTEMTIKITRRACDGFRDMRTFKTIKGARAFAVKYVGENPEIGSDYAVSADGVATIRVEGVTLRELFAGEVAAPKIADDYRMVRESNGDDWFLYSVYLGDRRLNSFDSAAEAWECIAMSREYDAYCAAGMA